MEAFTAAANAIKKTPGKKFEACIIESEDRSRRFNLEFEVDMKVEMAYELLKGTEEEFQDESLVLHEFRETGYRPMRNTELLLDVVADSDRHNNSIRLKPFIHKNVLARHVDRMFPDLSAMAHVRVKKKWKKRFLQLTGTDLFYASDSKLEDSILFASFAFYNIFFCEKAPKKCPTKFFLCLETKPGTYFEKDDDYVKYIAFESENNMSDWIKAILDAQVVHENVTEIKQLIKKSNSNKEVKNLLQPLLEVEVKKEEKVDTYKYTPASILESVIQKK